MHFNYEGRRFQVASNSETGESGEGTVFCYHQRGNLIWATYEGGSIQFGTLTGLVRADGTLDFCYQHVNTRDEICTGHCRSTPEVLPDGRLRLHEKWQWTSGDRSAGESVIEEI